MVILAKISDGTEDDDDWRHSSTDFFLEISAQRRVKGTGRNVRRKVENKKNEKGVEKRESIE